MTAGHRSVALTHYDGSFGALDNRCPHQGGPLGEGTIENGLLRCPWHGYDYCPLTGGSEFGDGAEQFEVELRADGGVWVAVPVEHAARAHRVRRDGRDARGVGRDRRVRHGRPLEPRARGRAAPPRGGRRAALHRHPARGRRRVRRVGLRQAHRPPGRVPDDRRPRRDQPADRPVGRAHGRRARAGADRPGRRAGARRGTFPGDRPAGRVRHGGDVVADGAERLPARRAGGARRAPRGARARRRASRLPRPGADAPRERRAALRLRRVACRTLRVAPPAAALAAGDRSACRRAASGDHRGHRRAPRARRRDRARRASRRAGDDDLPREGPDRRRSSARLRDARAQRHADRLLGHERGRRADRDRRVVRQPHRHLRRQADRARRPRPAPARTHDGRRRAAAVRRRRRGTRAHGGASGPCRRCARPGRRRRRAPRAVGDREGRPRRRRPRQRRRQRGGVRRAQSARARGRGDRRRRRQPRVQLRPLPRVARRARTC